MNRLLRAGCLAGAGKIDVKSDGSRTRVEFYGAALAPERLTHILEELFRDYGSAANELAGAANLAFGLAGCQVEIRLDDGQSAAVLVRKANGKTEAFQVETAARPHTSFQLTRSGKQRLGSFGASSAEYLSVVRRFRLAPFEITINKEEPPRSHAWGKRRDKWIDSREGVRLKKGLFSLGAYLCKHHHVAELRLCGSEAHLNGVGLKPTKASSTITVGDSPTKASSIQGCRLAFGVRADAALDSSASWVYCGETLQVFPVKLPLPGVEVAIDASDLKLDATREKLVQDEAFTERWEEVKREFSLFAAALQSAYPGKSASKLNAKVHFDKEARWTNHYKELRAEHFPEESQERATQV